MKSFVRRLRALPPGGLRLRLEAWLRLAAADLALRLHPARTVARALAPSGAARARPGGVEQPVAIGEAVASAAARHLWPMTCLPRSLALQRMLLARGAEARLTLGVRRTPHGIAAHAWVEVAGIAVGEPVEVEQRFLSLLSPRDHAGSSEP